MFPFPIARPQGCDIQTFYGPPVTTPSQNARAWNKPVGVSHIYMLVIGGGADGDTVTGGGSGAVTVWYGAAQHVPDSLRAIPAGTQTSSSITGGRLNSILLSANAGNGPDGGTAMPANQFTAMGFFQSVAGQAGWGGDASPSSTTFLLGGTSSGGTSTANYGYTRLAGNGSGYFQMQPIIVGMSGGGTGKGGIGCGGGLNSGTGGTGMVLIASW